MTNQTKLIRVCYWLTNYSTYMFIINGEPFAHIRIRQVGGGNCMSESPLN